jgi:hypothetical protein
LATRLAIQPGEEILGYGGNALTRRVAGVRTAERLFPNNEPLIFSEEAALRGARRGADAATQVLGRASEIELPAARDVANSARIEARSLPLNTAIFGHNLRRNLRGESTSFRQAAVRGELESADINMVDLEDVDVPTFGGEGDVDAGAGGDGSMRIGGSFSEFDLERRTDSGVVVERVRAPIETRSESELTQETVSEMESRAEASRRFETTTPTDSLVDVRTEQGAESIFETTQAIESVFDTEQSVESVFDTEQEIESIFETDQEIESVFDTEQETETAFEFEFETETNTETEVELFEEDKKKRKGADLDPWGAADRVFDTGVVQSLDELDKKWDSAGL